MPDEERSVIDAASDTAIDEVGESSQRGEGESHVPEKDSEKKIRENLRKEYERKKEKEVAEVKKQILDEMNTRIAELEKKRTLTTNQEDELEELRSKKDQIRKNPDSKVWKSFIEDVFAEQYGKSNYEDALDMVEDWADSEGIESAKFKKEINELLTGKYLEFKPTKRVKLAYRDWKKQKDIDKKLQKAEEIEKREQTFQETARGRVARKPSVSEDLTKARDNDNFSDPLDRLLGKI